jgi:hypothetical protein
MGVGDTAAPDERWIPILWVSVLLHDVFGGTNVVYAEVCGWESLPGLLYVSSMVHDMGIWRLGSLGGEVC